MLTGIKYRLIESCRITPSLATPIRTQCTKIGKGCAIKFLGKVLGLCGVLFSLLGHVAYAGIFSSSDPSLYKTQTLSQVKHSSPSLPLPESSNKPENTIIDNAISTQQNQSVKQLLGSTPYGWFNLIQEKPDFSENWETFDKSHLRGYLSDEVRVHYAKHRQTTSADTAVLSDILKTQPYVFEQENHVLTLKQRTVFDFPQGASYVGVHYLREIPHREPLTFIVTTADGQQKQFKSCTKSDELDKFSGFLGSGEVITRLEIRKPYQSSYVLGDVLWGRKDDLHQKKPCGTTLMPVVTSMECAEQGWLFDVEVSAMQSNDDSWWCVNDEAKQCGVYGEIASFGYYSKINRPTVELTFADQKNQQCDYSLVVDLPEKCSQNCNYVLRDTELVPVCPDRKSALLVHN